MSGMRSIGIVVLAGMTAAACGERQDRGDVAADPAGEVATTPAPAAVVEFDVEDVELGRTLGPDGRVADELDEFAASDTVFAVVQTEGAGPVTLTARWLFQDGQLVDETTQSISPTGETFTAFHVSKPDGWPAGEYEVKILVNGREEESESFVVC